MGRSEDKKVQDAAKDRAVLTPPRKKVRRERVEKAKWTWKAPRKKTATVGQEAPSRLLIRKDDEPFLVF